jgi:hypothetical protein
VQLRAWFEAQFLGERVPRVAVGGERVRLPAAPVQGEHELDAEALAERVAPHQRRQLGHQVGVEPKGEVGVEPVLDHREPVGLQPCRLLDQGGLALEVLEGRTAPQAFRGAQQLTRPVWLAGRDQPPAAAGEVDEALGVHLVRPGDQAVAGVAPPGDPVGAQDPPQPVDIDPQVVACRGGWALAPEGVGQAAGGDRLVRMAQEHGQEQPLLGRPERQSPAPRDGLERPQDLEFHRHPAPEEVRRSRY